MNEINIYNLKRAAFDLKYPFIILEIGSKCHLYDLGVRRFFNK